MSEACCTVPPVKSDYVGKGTLETFEDLQIYSAGPKDSKTVYISFYDIFGNLPNVQQFADKLAEATGDRVVMPDFFKGKPWPQDKFPPADIKDLISWIGEAGNWEKVIKPYLPGLFEKLKKEGAIRIASYGFCWGGKIAVQLASSDFPVSAIAIIHPSFCQPEDANNINCPVIVIPSKDEPDFTPFMENLKKKPFADKCEHHRFGDVPHGWCGARGDYKNEVHVKRATEVITLVANYFKRNVH
eukprot:TRINITY_DN1277_c0_g2_i1.p1 TRINITY_DN1277_c0_g2~~TRINITY_DN1277_c0_g2_i1.p1  ORF type:complete len:265 (+),score=54.82 TRINITY_DN1277_c0_g2_i1:69-797(+)